MTIGSKWLNGINRFEALKIGSNVLIGARAIILGDIMVGDNVIVRAGAVVTINIPSDSMAIGNPAL